MDGRMGVDGGADTWMDGIKERRMANGRVCGWLDGWVGVKDEGTMGERMNGCIKAWMEGLVGGEMN